MTKLKLFAAAAILSSALAGPAMAQQVISNPEYQNNGINGPTTGKYQPRAAYRNNDNWDNGWNSNANNDRGRNSNASYDRDGNRSQWRNDNSGFWPGEIAAGVVGGAIGTAGAIATAPFRGNANAYDDSYAYDNGPAPIGGEAYARQNGFVCMPGTWFKGEDGRRHICQ